MRRAVRRNVPSSSGMLGPLLSLGFAATLVAVFVAAWFLRFDPRFLLEILESITGPVGTR